jgi:tripartite-type tricarboxylate transporter receptor subunit TctC
MKRFLFAVLLLSIGTSVHAQADFYKGKTIRLVIGYSAGGTNDLWARAIARYWGKHIPGNPEFIVQNMPGAATLVAANYIYGVEKPDGLTLGLIAPALVFNQLGGQKEVKFDWAKFTWIGSPEETSEMLSMRSDTPYKTLDDIRHSPIPRAQGPQAQGQTFYSIQSSASRFAFLRNLASSSSRSAKRETIELTVAMSRPKQPATSLSL